MRPLRNFKTNQCGHLISCIANCAIILNDEEKTLRNHFHILAYVPEPRELSDDELLARIRAFYIWPATSAATWSRRRRTASDAACEGRLHIHRESGERPFAVAEVSSAGKGQEDGAMKLLHHFYSTIGVRPMNALERP